MTETQASPSGKLGRVPGREAFNDSLVSALAEANGSDAVGVLLLGLDHFRDVNGAFGHAVGDRFLAEVARRIRQLDRGNRTVARVGGDVFAVIEVLAFDDCDLLADLAANIAGVLDNPFCSPTGELVDLSGTTGIACASVGSTSVANLLRSAEIAMYRAKAHGLQSAVYDAGLDEMTADRLAHAADLRRAIAERELTVHYQPIVDITTGRAESLEALVRWQHPVRGLVPPGEFIQLAEENGLIRGVTQFVISEVADQMRRWSASGKALPCAINVSAHCLTDPLCSDALIATLSGLSGLVTVEVTETAIVDQRAVGTLERLAAAAVPSAIDDFGTGYASLGSLKSLPTTTLKIDRSLIQDIECDQRDFDIAQGIVSLARSFGLAVIAEGIETEEAASRLRDAGVVFGQGYWFARPMPAPELEAWLTSHNPVLAKTRLTAPTQADLSSYKLPHDHAVLLYETEAHRVQTVTGFLSAGLESGEQIIIVATSQHRAELLVALPHDRRVTAERDGRLVLLDAHESLSQIMRDGRVDAELFESQIARVVRGRADRFGSVRVYGEMVTKLWSAGNVVGALELEQLWTDLQQQVEVSVLCAYPLGEVNSDSHVGLAQVCRSHSTARIEEHAPATAASSERLELQVLLPATRSLLYAQSPEAAVQILKRTIADLGGSTAPAATAPEDAIPVDISLGTSPPVLPVAAFGSWERAVLERVIPGLVEDARTAVGGAGLARFGRLASPR